MTESEQPDVRRRHGPERELGQEERELTQEERALEAIWAIGAGADPTAEAFRLSNEFTDRQTARFWAWLRRRKP
ncbi:MAG: hypothetical protein QOE16_1277 [Microbacteriaceae bacterium]|jgi:hypothetical protein|nr:hypothetical protein [Microbacteriaceae bacterium]